MIKHIQFILTFWLLLYLSCSTAYATELSISPVRLDLAAEHPIASLTLTNSGNQPTIFQITPKKWTQSNGKNLLTNTDEILVTPPIVTILPNSSQVIRVGLMVNPDNNSETSYRILL